MKIRNTGNTPPLSPNFLKQNQIIDSEPKEVFTKTSSKDQPSELKSISGAVVFGKGKEILEGMKRTKAAIHKHTDSDEKTAIYSLKFAERTENFYFGEAAASPAGKGFFRIKIKSDRSGANAGNTEYPREYSITGLDEKGQETKEVPLKTSTQYEGMNILSGGDGRVAVGDKKTITLFDKDLNKLWTMPKNSTVMPKTFFSDDGSLIIYDVKKGYNSGGPNHTLFSVKPNGEKAWETDAEYGALASNEKGQILLGKEKRPIRVINPDGTEEEPIPLNAGGSVEGLIPIDDRYAAAIVADSDLEGSNRIAIADRQGDTKIWSTEKFNYISDTAFDAKTETIFTITGNSFYETSDTLTAIGLDGKVKWETKLPNKNSSGGVHHVKADGKGNLYLILDELSSGGKVPPSFEKLLSDSGLGSNFKDVHSARMCLSADSGKIKWLHKKKEKSSRAEKPIIRDSGDVVVMSSEGAEIISGETDKIEKQVKADFQRAIEEEVKKEESAQTEDKKINVDGGKGIVNIGGVDLPINRKEQV